MEGSESDRVLLIIEKLTERFGRIPTEDEVMTFIYGSHLDRYILWNAMKKVL